MSSVEGSCRSSDTRGNGQASGSRRRRSADRAAFAAGYTLAEAIVTLLLLALIVHVAWSVTARHGSSILALMRRAEVMDAVRITSWVLRQELAVGRPGEDWRLEDEVLSLRAFRGFGHLCADAASPGTLVTVLSGVRDPDPAKDSVLVLTPWGTWEAAGIGRMVKSPSCGGLPTRALELEDARLAGLIVRFFERGSYHLADGALRYRRGLGGRQPLTPRVVGADSGLFADAQGLLAMLSADLPDEEAVAWHRTLRFAARKPVW